jgi:PKD repeat protein
MRSKPKRKTGLNKNPNPRMIVKPRRNWKSIAFAIYITFLLLSTIPYMADRSIEPVMKDSYTYHLKYRTDGKQSHYYVERVDTAEIGKIDLVYTTKSNSLMVDVENIKVLHIYCRSMYEDECKKVYGIDPADNSNYYKWYFIEKNHLNVNIDSDSKIEELSFIDTPIPYKVLVNGMEWKDGLDYTFKDNYRTVLSNVPAGITNVDIYFKPEKGTPPFAQFNASRTIVPVNYTIMFDATGSFDPDGIITRYIMDFGDETFHSGDRTTHSYTKPGIYGAILTVRDDEYLVDHAYVNITVVQKSNLPEIQGIVPDQIRPEDSPPWELNLTMFEPIANSEDIEFYWYITGENTSMYSIAGENSTNDKIIFSPEHDAFGNDMVNLWLHNSEQVSVSQPLWINITSVNDPPTILSIPDLVLHYNDPYTFNYLPYVNDKETPKDQLNLSIFDGFEEQYITINGLNATFEYPQSLVGKTVYVTVMVSDDEAIAQDLISIQITSDYVPKLTKSLPDVWLFEGTTKYNVFDLDDFFMDPDNDAIYFTYGAEHLSIMINLNHSVDITADSEWTGNELVTFRARDPMGALAEDSIVVSVLPVNDPPTISGVPDFFIRYDNDYRFDLTPYIHDNDNTTNELTIIPSDPEHIRLDVRNNMVIILNYPEEFLDQKIPVRFTVFDGLDSGFQEVTVTITEDFPPELLSPIPDIVFLEDQVLRNAFDLDNFFLDVDGDVLYFTTGNEFIEISINYDHSVELSAPQDWFGNELVYFRATDPTGALQQDLVKVTVLPVNDPPFLLELPAQYGNESERWTLDLEPYISDVDNNISEMEISVNNDYVVVSGSNLIFLGVKELGDTIEVTVDDGQFSTTRSVDVHLRIKEPPKATTLWDLLLYILPFLIIMILIILGIAGALYRKKRYFKTEEVFLIHKGGTLITHLSRNAQANVDDIIFSGMFTAVQDFIKDTFVSGDDPDDETEQNKWALDELKLGDNNILIERSDNTYLAVIFSGEGSKRLRKIVIKLLHKIETQYWFVLPKWDGNITKLKGTNAILSALIKIDDASDEDSSESVSELVVSASKNELSVEPKESEPEPQSLLSMLGKASDSESGMNQLIKNAKRTSSTIPQATTIPLRKPPKHNSKELLNVSSQRTGAESPGLASWPLQTRNGDKNAISVQTIGSRFGAHVTKDDKLKLPTALNINPTEQRVKTIVINKSDQRSVKSVNERHGLHPRKTSNNFSSPKKSTFIKVKMPGSNKVHNIDPTKSLLSQLADLDD